MYCSNCGKFIDYDAKLCKECEAELVKQTKSTDTTADQDVPPYQGDMPPYGTEVPPYGFYGQQGYYQPQMDPYSYSTEPDPTNRMYGFGKALTSTILSFFGFLFAYISVVLGAFEPEAGVVILLISLPCTVISFIFGLQSINTFRARKATCAKPIATLVLGIEGISTAGVAIFVSMMALIVIGVGGVI